MFLKMSKIREPFSRKSAVTESDTAESEKPEEGSIGEEKIRINPITSLEELVNKRTRDLEEAKEQLKKLSSNAIIPDGEEKEEAEVSGLFTQPNQSKGKPPEQTEGAAAEKTEDPITVLNSTVPKTAEKKAEEKAPPKIEAKADSFTDLFSHQEEEENPLRGLIASLPDITAIELLNEAQQIKSMMFKLAQN